MLWYIITPVVMAIVILLLIKVFGGKYSTTTEEVHRKPPKQLEYTWDGVFGVLFFIGASIMGASFPIRALMLLVGIVGGHMVRGVVEGLKERKNVSRDNKPKDEQRKIKA